LGSLQQRWPDFLKHFGPQQPSIAGKLRQGLPSSIEGATLKVSFESLFEKQRLALSTPETINLIEKALEEHVEASLKVELVANKKELANSADDEIGEPGSFEEEAKRPSARVVQKVFGVNIRGVLPQAPPPAYHLGQNDHFKENRSDDGPQ
jgi:hypothetical protein